MEDVARIQIESLSERSVRLSGGDAAFVNEVLPLLDELSVIATGEEDHGTTMQSLIVFGVSGLHEDAERTNTHGGETALEPVIEHVGRLRRLAGEQPQNSKVLRLRALITSLVSLVEDYADAHDDYDTQRWSVHFLYFVGERFAHLFFEDLSRDTGIKRRARMNTTLQRFPQRGHMHWYRIFDEQDLLARIREAKACSDVEPDFEVCRVQHELFVNVYRAPRCESGNVRPTIAAWAASTTTQTPNAPSFNEENQTFYLASEPLFRAGEIESATIADQSSVRLVLAESAATRFLAWTTTASQSSEEGQRFVLRHGTNNLFSARIMTPISGGVITVWGVSLDDLCERLTEPTLPAELELAPRS